jgi:hypothetical protein
MTERGRPPMRNWAAVVLVIAGSLLLVATISNATIRSIPNAPTASFAIVFGLQLASFLLVPVAILVAFRVFGSGTARLEALGGDGLGQRLMFVLTALFALAAQYSLLGPILVVGDSGRSATPEFTASYVLDGTAFALAIVTSIVIIRGGVVRGFARSALPIATLLTAISLVGSNLVISLWGDVPHGLAVLLLGIGYWRAGLPVGIPVPARPKSLAE